MGVKDILQEFVKEFPSSGAQVDMKATQRHYTLEDWKAAMCRQLNSVSDKFPTRGDLERSYKVHSAAYCDNTKIKSGNKILLPHSVCDALTKIDIPTPWIFEIQTDRGIGTYCGVLEFVAPDAQIIVPSWMMTDLSLEEGSVVQVRCVNLPIGTGITFQPHSMAFLKLVDGDRGKMLSLLQWVLQDYSTLSMGDTIEIVQQGQSYLLNILETKPARAISLVGALDLEINIEFAKALDFRDEAENFDPLAMPGQKARKEKWSDESSEEETEETEESEEESDDFGTEQGKKLGDDESTLRASQSSKCNTCGRLFPLSSIDVHAAMCARHNVLCEKCNGVFKKGELEAHLASAHTTVDCKCGMKVDKYFMNQHKDTECLDRNVLCDLCGLQLFARDLQEHKNICESKTSACGYCQRWILVKDYTEHLRTCSLNPANEEQYVFQCLFCQATNGDETLYMEEDMIFHLKTAHGVSKNVVCPICFMKSPEAMTVVGDLKSHVDSHEVQLIRKRRIEQRGGF